MLVNVYTKTGQVKGQLELPDDVFGVEPHEHAMHLAVKVYLANQRQGTHKTKTRAEVSGGGKKPWKQKGRGTARSGSSRSPVWVGGGTIHGPKPHSYTLNLPAKVRKLARKSALSLRAREEKGVVVVDDLSFDTAKTKNMAAVLKALGLEGTKTLVLVGDESANLMLSARNIDRLDMVPADNVSTYHILCHKTLLVTPAAIEKIVKTFNG